MSKLCDDHLGNHFPSESAMCRHWGVNLTTFRVRLGRGLSLVDALTTPVIQKATPCVDHLGNEFPTQKAMCEHWGVNQSSFCARVNRGLSLSDALATPISFRGHRMPCTDHLGNEFPSEAAMCRHWAVSQSTFKNRIANGWTLEEALSGDRRGRKAVCDHLGNEFPSEAAMCRHWGVSQDTFRARLGKGVPLSDALTTPVARRGLPCTDHLGNEFPSVRAMCRHWGIDPVTFRFRLGRGVPLADALTTPTAGRATRCKPCVDHLGNEYPSIAAMCEHWGVSFDTYKNRRRIGWDLERALTEPLHGGGENVSPFWRSLSGHVHMPAETLSHE